jgi:hypothetical protein
MRYVFVLIAAASVIGAATPSFAGTEEDLDEILMAPPTKPKPAATPKKEELPARTAPKPTDEEPQEDFDLLEEDDAEPPSDFRGDVSEEDDVDVGLPRAPERKTVSRPAPVGPGPITLDVAGKEPLSDNYPVNVVAVDRDSVVVELPVLVARSRVGLTEPFVLIAEAWVGPTKVSQVSQTITKEGLAEFGPSFVFVKLLAPVVEKTGEVTLRVKRAKLDGTQPKDLFSRATPYALP